MNTRFTYSYRGGDNYKKGHQVVLVGELFLADIQGCLKDGTDFIPYQVGLPELQPTFSTGVTKEDQVWHEVEDFEPTTETGTLTAVELKAAFQKARNNWDEAGAYLRLGMNREDFDIAHPRDQTRGKIHPDDLYICWVEGEAAGSMGKTEMEAVSKCLEGR